MKLYHYTSTRHVDRILRDGYLKVTESNLSMHRANAGPGVVWLSSEDIPLAAEDGLDGSSADKTAVRFTVDVDDAIAWLDWSRRRGITKTWAAALEEGRRAETWYVVTRPIPRAEWVALHVNGEQVDIDG